MSDQEMMSQQNEGSREHHGLVRASPCDIAFPSHPAPSMGHKNLGDLNIASRLLSLQGLRKYDFA